MTAQRRLAEAWRRPEARRWALVLAGMAVAHVVVFTLMAPAARTGRWGSEPREVAPVFLDITPLARPARTPPAPTTVRGEAALSPLPPIAVRPPAPAPNLEPVPPLRVETAPRPVERPGRIIPRSWRERCGLPADGPVSDEAWRACEQQFLNAAGPAPGPPGRRGDPASAYAAEGARRLAQYEAQRAPTPVGGGLARPSAEPGSNFGMGAMDDSVVYATGSRPQTMGRED